MQQVLSILIADDHPLYRKALKGTLGFSFKPIEVIEACSFAEAKMRLREDMDLVLLDLAMPDTTGFDALIALRSLARSVPIVIVSAFADLDSIRKAATYGASGFIPKTAEPAVITEAVQAVLAGRCYWPNSKIAPSPAASMPGDLSKLTRAEARVLTLMTEGKANKQIAYELGIQESTVKSHVTSMLRKLNVNSRTQAVLLTRTLGETTG